MEKKLEAEHVYRYDVFLKIDLDKEYVYTNVDFFKKLGVDGWVNWDAINQVENHIQNLVFTKEKIEELKKKACEKIMASPNPFEIQCGDIDGGYYIESENELLENKINL